MVPQQGRNAKHLEADDILKMQASFHYISEIQEAVTMVKQIVGGIVVLVIGGTTVAVSQSDIVDNFSKETGMTQQEAKDYIKNTKTESWTKVGQSFIDDGNMAITALADIDCTNYDYEWETPSLSCTEGKDQLRTVGNDEIKLGNCYRALDTGLGNSVKSKIRECISDIETVDSDYTLPIATSLLDGTTLTEAKNTNAYNKSVLEAVIKAK